MREDKHIIEHPTKWYLERIEYLCGFITPEREQVMRKVAGDRTRYMTVCMENTYYAHNASALIRHCDAFGIQDIHTVEALCRFDPSTDVVRGSDKWITLRRHATTSEAVDALCAGGYRIVATTPHIGDTTPERFDIAAGPFALVFGTEKHGISPEMVAAADEFLCIPMWGFVESLNISAAAAIILYMLSSRLRESSAEWQMTEWEQAEILFRWLKRSVRDSAKILQRFEEGQGPQ